MTESRVMKIFVKLSRVPARLARVFSGTLVALLLCACGQDSMPAGVIASVNGEPITLHAVQALLDSRSSWQDMSEAQSLDDMRENYCRGVSQLIVHALVRQELARLGLTPAKEDFDKAVKNVEEDFGEESLKKFLADSAIREDDWRSLMRDHLALETFKKQILSPGLKAGLDEVKNYYREHQKDFILPKSWHVCFLSAESINSLQGWCDNFARGIIGDEVVHQCRTVQIEEIPAFWQTAIASLKAPSCARPREEDGEWRSLALLEKIPARTLDLAEAYALVENILLARDRNRAFAQWLEKRTGQSRILLSPELKGCFKAPGETSGERPGDNAATGAGGAERDAKTGS